MNDQTTKIIIYTLMGVFLVNRIAPDLNPFSTRNKFFNS